MNISKKLGAAAASTIALTIIFGGAVSANAAEGDVVNPQPNGSTGAFFIWDGNTGEFADQDAARVYDRAESLITSASRTDVLAEIMPSDYVNGQAFTQVFKFVTPVGSEMGGNDTWLAYDNSAAAGPNGGVLTDNFTLEERGLKNGAGIDQVFQQGGTYSAGIAFTYDNGVNVAGVVYRTIHVEAGTGKYTIDPVVLEGATAPDPVTEADLTAGLETLVVAAPAAGSTVLQIDAGVANANKTLSAGAFSALVDLGQVTLDATGKGSIDVAGKGFVAGESHKLFLAESDGTVVAWSTFALVAGANTDNTDLTVDVTTSNRFEFVAPVNQTVDLGDVKRNKTTTPVALGQFSVIDDRDVLLGWNLNISATAFTGPGGATIASTALGYTPAASGGTQDGVTLGTAKTAGGGAFGVLASGAANSSTTEDGAIFNTDLTFKAPVDAAKGTYHSTLTLDLVSK